MILPQYPQYRVQRHTNLFIPLCIALSPLFRVLCVLWLVEDRGIVFVLVHTVSGNIETMFLKMGICVFLLGNFTQFMCNNLVARLQRFSNSF
jgi:hypothetical protein